MFHAARDARPFRVQAEAMRVDIRAADLSIRLTGAGARITVKDGSVLAERADGSGPTARPLAELGPSSQAMVGPAGAQVHRVSIEEVDRALAWRQGAIALDGQTLAEAAAEFNRYNSHQIVVAQGPAASIRLGGYFQASDVDGFVAAVARTFPVEVSRRSDGAVLISGRS
jgi:transmembrane sensor